MLSQKVEDYERSTAQYFKDITSFEPLKKDEENRLFIDYKENGNMAARDRILKANLKFVISVAKFYKNKGLAFADLVAEGNNGLMKAIERYDPYKLGNDGKPYKFISYAVWWIKQTIIEAIEKRNNLLAEEIQEKGQIDDDNDNICMAYAPTEDNSSYIDEGGYNAQQENEIKKALAILMENLNERETNILSLYFGLTGKKPMTLEEIGNIYGLTKERVRQINERSLKKMRAAALAKTITSDIYR